MDMEIMQCYAKPSDFPEMKKKRQRRRELSNTNANLQYNFPEEISSLQKIPLEPLNNTSNGVVPVEVKDTATVPSVNIRTDLIPTSEKKKKRKKPRRKSKNPKTINTNDDNLKGVSLENAAAERNPCLNSSAGVDGTVNSLQLASFEDIIPKEKTFTTNNGCFKGVSLENASAERSPCLKSFSSNDGKIDSQHLSSFEDTLSEKNSCLELLVCNDGTTDLEHDNVTSYMACSEKKKKRKKKKKQKSINDCGLLEGGSLVKNSLQKDNECVKTSAKMSEGMDSEGGKSCPLLGSVAENGEQELNTKYRSSENHGMHHAMLNSVGVPSPGTVGVDSLFAVASLDTTEIKKKSLGPGPVDVNNGENVSWDAPIGTAVLDSTNIEENSPSPPMAETCRREIIENDFKSFNSENSLHSFKDSLGDTSHFPDETNTYHLLTANLSCSQKKKKKKKKKKKGKKEKKFVPCESNNKFCDRLLVTTSTDNILTDHDEPLKPPVEITTNMELKEENSYTKSISSLEKGENELHKKCNAWGSQQIDFVMQDSSCVVRHELIDAHISDKGCQDFPLEVTVLDSADIINKTVVPYFADAKSPEKDCGDSLLDVAGLDSNDIEEKMASSGMENFKRFEDDCKDSNFHSQVLNTTGIKEKSLTFGEPCSFLDIANTSSLKTHGGHAEVDDILLESRDTKTCKRRKRARKYLVDQVKLSNIGNSSRFFEDSTGGTPCHHLDTMYTDDLLKSKLESRCSGLHAITEKISRYNLNKKAESSGDGSTSEEKKEGMKISLAEISCTQSYMKNSSSELDVSEGNLENEHRVKLEKTSITKTKLFHIDDGLNYTDKSTNACSLSDTLCGSSKSNSVQIETKMGEAPSSLHSGAAKDDPDLDAVGKLGNPSPERYLVVDSRKKLLILDVNGLLVDFVNPIPKGYRHDKVISKKAVFRRPYCDEFLQFCFGRFNVGVWSSRTKRNVDTVVEFLMGNLKHKLLFCWDQSHCTNTGYRTIENREKPLLLKELRKLWDKCDPDLPWEKGEFNETNTLLLDDSPYKAILNPAYTAIFPKPFTYRHINDSSLGPKGDLRIYLEDLANAENVQKYVKINPFGQQAIGKSNPSWNFYSKIINVKR